MTGAERGNVCGAFFVCFCCLFPFKKNRRFASQMLLFSIPPRSWVSFFFTASWEPWGFLPWLDYNDTQNDLMRKEGEEVRASRFGGVISSKGFLGSPEYILERIRAEKKHDDDLCIAT
jgi:hypothetical protein